MKMSDFMNKYKDLTVGEALELNKIAKETCEFETTSVECEEL